MYYRIMLNSEIQQYAALSKIFAALADPTRLAILDTLTKGEATVNELAQPSNLSLPTISKHLYVLEEAGLISRSKRAQWRPRKLEPKALEPVAQWMKHYEPLWTESLSHLGDFLKAQQGKGR